MNILPKKRWHVRTKDNIARVRKDELAANEEEQKRQEKLQLAESEARINFLRKKSGLPECPNEIGETLVIPTNQLRTATNGSEYNEQHVNLFADYRSHIKSTNKSLEEEKKQEREKYEKQIGYLTYLGQDTNEALKLRSWYEVLPQRAIESNDTAIEKDLKNKSSQDPLTLINAILPRDHSMTLKPSTIKQSHEDSEPTICHSLIANKIKKHKHRVKKLKCAKDNKEKKHRKHKRKHKKDKGKRKTQFIHEESGSDSEKRQQIKREKLETLRKERLLREASERAREQALLAPKNSTTATTTTKELNGGKAIPVVRIVQKYNSQFNPEIAKQNMI